MTSIRTSASASMEDLVEIARDLSTHLATSARYQRLLDAIQRIMPCDATALLRLDGSTLTPLAVTGLRAEILGQRFALGGHPRLAQIIRAHRPVRFRRSTLPDPFDGWLDGPGPDLSAVHACMGCALRIDDQTVGALTMDAADPAAFDGIDDDAFALLAAFAAAALRTASLFEAVEQVAQRAGQVARVLAQDAERRSGLLLGMAPAMATLRDDIAAAAKADGVPVLVIGETGAGKELVARAIHAASPRAERPMIQVNCASLPESMADSELFGHVAGAFTGAQRARVGRFETADGGTLFLDEVGELTASVQPKLLRALQFGEIQRVGADRPHRADVRIIAATNRDLRAEANRGRFRADLYHRLNVIEVRVPPLRERREDILLLVGHFLDRARTQLGTAALRLTREASRALVEQPWPGNVRELEHTVLRAAVRAAGAHSGLGPCVVSLAHLGLAPVDSVRAVTPALQAAVPAGVTLAQATDDFRRQAIAQALATSGGNVAAAARRLGLDRSNLTRLLARLGSAGSE
ncbi:MAG: nitric oxide reductase transcriptional regulator NorR [Myxococcales bacterium]|nr:nitric oxide reductase transcriptional regulator NorR [Myxococcales bacterium]